MKNKIILIALLGTLIFSSCNKFLDRPFYDKFTDDEFWKSEGNIEMYLYKFYDLTFPGYGRDWAVEYAMYHAVRYKFDDGLVKRDAQTTFPANNAPKSTQTAILTTGITGTTSSTLARDWDFSWVKAALIMEEKINEKSGLSEAAKNKWIGYAKFFKAMQWAELVERYGDVPYYTKTFTTSDIEKLYAPRTSRVTIMDDLYNEFKFAYNNVPATAPRGQLNKYVVAAMASRVFLIEASWHKYHNAIDGVSSLDPAKAATYYGYAAEFAKYVIDSGNYACSVPYRDEFTTEDLFGKNYVLFYREYSTTGYMHAVSSYNNGWEGEAYGANQKLIKTFLGRDGNVYDPADKDYTTLSMESLAQKLDPRFEAIFEKYATHTSHSGAATRKYIEEQWIGNSTAKESSGSTNTTDAPVVRYAEVLLNYAEAKAELGEFDQAVADATINHLRKRPIKPTNPDKSISLTPYVTGTGDSYDGVTGDIAAIRRERRIELLFDGMRQRDLKRWKQMTQYVTTGDPDALLGPWVDFSDEGITQYLPTIRKRINNDTLSIKGVRKIWLEVYTGAKSAPILSVKQVDGTIVACTGKDGKWGSTTLNFGNIATLKGYLMISNAEDRQTTGLHDINSYHIYLESIPRNQYTLYANQGKAGVLTYNPGWVY